jgi:hypothetical protein
VSKSTILAEGQITSSPHNTITVELIELDDQARVMITWPKKTLSISPRRFPDLAASLTRLFANASTELARIKAGL